MIMRGDEPHRLSRSGLLVALTLGVAMLAFTPSRGQVPAPPTPPVSPEEESPRSDPLRNEDSREQPAPRPRRNAEAEICDEDPQLRDRWRWPSSAGGN